MAAQRDPQRVTSVPEDRPAPYWPVLHYLYDDDEILATLFWDDEEPPGFCIEPDGTLGAEVETSDEPGGWCVVVYASTAPGMDDPRVSIPIVECLGDLPVAEALAAAAEIVADRAEPIGCTHEESRQRLLWRELGPEAGGATDAS